MSVIDAITGQQLACFDAPVEATSLVGGPVLSSNSPAVYVEYATSSGEGPEDRPLMYGIWGQEIAPEHQAERLVDHSWELSESDADGNGSMVLTQGGLVLVTWNHERLVAIDARTGEFDWELDRTEMPESRTINLVQPAAGSGYQISGRTAEDIKFYNVDACGNLSYIELFGALPPSISGIRRVGNCFVHPAVESGGRTVRDAAFQELFVIPDCGTSIALSEERILCRDVQNNLKGAIHVDLESQNVAKIDLEELFESEGTAFLAPSLALQGGDVLLQGTISEQMESGLNRLYSMVALLRQPQDNPQIELLYKAEEGSTALRGPLSHRGVLYFRQKNRLFAVQLPVDGPAARSGQ